MRCYNITLMKFISNTKKYIGSHKKISIVALIIIIVCGYYIYKTAFASPAVPQYVLAPVTQGKITQTVTGSGQVSSENQLDVASEVSGKITSIKVTVGQQVKMGDVIATLDAHDALVALQSAQISYQKLTEPAKAADLSTATNNLTKAYSDGFSNVAAAFIDFPGIMSGLKDMLYSTSGYLSNNQNQDFTETGREYRQTAGVTYDKTSVKYTTILSLYKTLDKNSSREKIDDLIVKTYDFAKDVAQAVRDAQNAVNFISVSQPDYSPTGAATAATNVNAWLSQANSHVSSLLSSKNSIESNIDSVATLEKGADELDIRAERLSLSEKQRTYEKYFIKAPFDGIIGRIPVKVYDQAGSGTIIATLSSSKKMTTIPLNEVDAVKVKKGNKVELTFDAITGLSVTGIVDSVDLVGTQSQGVVTYNIKIIFEGTDERILPGMSVDATIITEEKSGILVVPAGAIKGKGKATYVEAFDTGAAATAPNGRTRMITVSSATPPQQIKVTVGQSDDTNTEIVSGLTEGQTIVIRTIAAGTATASTATPTLFSSLGGQRSTQGAVRAGGAR